MEEDHSETDHLASLQSIQALMVDSKMLNSVPALKLFTSTKQLCGVGVASNQAPPTSASPTTSLEAHREAVVYSLHLVYEVHYLSVIICHQDCVAIGDEDEHLIL